MILNSIVADTLEIVADRLEAADDFKEALNDLIVSVISEHKRIIFNGNSYSEAWKKEAGRRGLINWPGSAEALSHYTDKKFVEMFRRQKVLSEEELQMRRDVLLENYSSSIRIEALTMLEMANRAIIPQALQYQKELAQTVVLKSSAVKGIDVKTESTLLQDISALTSNLYETMQVLNRTLRQVPQDKDPYAAASFYYDTILPLMRKMRSYADKIELIEGEDYLPYPSYQDLLYSVY